MAWTRVNLWCMGADVGSNGQTGGMGTDVRYVGANMWQQIQGPEGARVSQTGCMKGQVRGQIWGGKADMGAAGVSMGTLETDMKWMGKRRINETNMD